LLLYDVTLQTSRSLPKKMLSFPLHPGDRQGNLSHG